MLISAALDISSYTLRGIDKFLSIYVTDERYQNYEEVRNEAKKLYLKDVDIRNKEAVARAYTNVSVLNLFYFLYKNHFLSSYQSIINSFSHQAEIVNQHLFPILLNSQSTSTISV